MIPEVKAVPVKDEPEVKIELPKEEKPKDDFKLKEEKPKDDFKLKEDSPDSEEAQRKIYELHKENAARRFKEKELQKELDSINAKIKKQDEAKLKEDGKLKELLEAKEKELEDLKKVKEQNKKYEKSFQTQLEAVLKKLSESQQTIINESGWSLDKKLTVANQFVTESKPQSVSVDAARPGGDGVIKNINLDDYKGKAGLEKLLRLRTSNPNLFKLVTELKKSKE
jgi:hypothetical protein